MKILTVKVQHYRGCPIYIRNYGIHFEFLVIYHKKLYCRLVEVTPVWWRRFLPQKYSAAEMTKAAEILYSGATLTVDKLIDPNYVDLFQTKT